MSDSDDPNLEINVAVNGAGESVANIGSVETAEKNLGAAADEVSQKHESATGQLREFGRSGSETREIVESLSRASQGGAGAIGAMAQATRAFFGLARGALAGSGLGLLILGLGSIVGLFTLFKKGTDDASEGLKKNAEDAEALKKKTEELEAAAKKEADQQMQSLNEIHKLADQEIDDLDRNLKNTIQLTDAKKAYDQSVLEGARQAALSKAATPEEKDKINAQFDQQKDALDAATALQNAESRRAVAAFKILEINKEQLAIELKIAEAKDKKSAADEKAADSVKKSRDAFDDEESQRSKLFDKSSPQSISDLDVEARISNKDQVQTQHTQFEARVMASVAARVKREQDAIIEKANTDLDENRQKASDAEREHALADLEAKTIPQEQANKDKSTKNAEADELKKAAAEEARKSTEAAAKAKKEADDKAKLDADQAIENAKADSLQDAANRSLDLDTSDKLSGEAAAARAGTSGDKTSKAIEELKNKVPKPLAAETIIEPLKGFGDKIVAMQTGTVNALNAQAKMLDYFSAQIAALHDQVAAIDARSALTAQQLRISQTG